MISINTDKKLNIILPNTNKALAEVIKDASPKELELITKGKDLKSIIGSLLKDSSKDSSSDKTLLALVKNNPTLKELGSTNLNIKELLSTLKADKNLQGVEKLLQKFLPNIKELNSSNIKPNILNSGVFLESKLKDVQNPQVDLKTRLTQLLDIVTKSKLPSSKMIAFETKELLNSPLLSKVSNESLTIHVKENPKALAALAKDVQSLIDKFKSEFKNADPITTKEFSTKLAKLEHLIDSNNLNKDNLKLSSLQDSIKEVSSVLERSFTNKSKSSLDSINSVLNNIKAIEHGTTQTPKNIDSILKDISTIIDNIRTKSKGLQTPSIKELLSKLDKLDNTISQDIKLPLIQSSIQDVRQSLQNSSLKDSGNLLDALSKIFKALKTDTLEQIIDKKVPTELKTVLDDIKASVKNTDPLFSKPTKAILNELSMLKTSTQLAVDNNVKNILSNDFKAVLHNLNDEIAKLSLPNQNEILKQVDRLLMQIDYHQLVSHLSGASSLYIPYSWDEMEDGSITIKKSSNDKFYCDIELKLKEYGELKLRLTLYDKNQLNLHISSENDEFKEIIKESIPILRKALIDIQITPREIRFINKSKNQLPTYKDDSKNLDIGFEVKA